MWYLLFCTSIFGRSLQCSVTEIFKTQHECQFVAAQLNDIAKQEADRVKTRCVYTQP